MADDVSLVYLSTASTILPLLILPPRRLALGLPLLLNHPLLLRSLSLSLPFSRQPSHAEECHAGLTRCICLSRALHAAEKKELLLSLSLSLRCVRPAEMDEAKENLELVRSGKAAFIRMLTRWTRIVQDDDKRRIKKGREILFRFPPDFFVDEDSRLGERFLGEEERWKGSERYNSESCLKR